MSLRAFYPQRALVETAPTMSNPTEAESPAEAVN